MYGGRGGGRAGLVAGQAEGASGQADDKDGLPGPVELRAVQERERQRGQENADPRP